MLVPTIGDLVGIYILLIVLSMKTDAHHNKRYKRFIRTCSCSSYKQYFFRLDI